MQSLRWLTPGLMPRNRIAGGRWTLLAGIVLGSQGVDPLLKAMLNHSTLGAVYQQSGKAMIQLALCHGETG